MKEIKNFKSGDLLKFEENDEKEQKNIFKFYQNCETMSEKSLKNMNKIYQEFNVLVPKMKFMIFSDESKWQQWNATDFRKFVRKGTGIFFQEFLD